MSFISSGGDSVTTPILNKNCWFYHVLGCKNVKICRDNQLKWWYPCMHICTLYQWCIAKRSPSSIATISAHLMLWPSLSQLGQSFQASHSSSKMIPMPHEEEALTQNWIGEESGGLDREELQKCQQGEYTTKQYWSKHSGWGSYEQKERKND